MKPTKNRFVCPDCGKVKMLFGSEEEAERFIRWNGSEINAHGGTLRAYYCDACCGWHITHVEYRDSFEGRTDKLINAYHSDEIRKKEYEKRILQSIECCGYDIFMSRRRFKTWAKVHVADEMLKFVLDMTGQIRSDMTNGKEDWRADYLMQQWKM